MSSQPIQFTNVRLVDPASGYDGPGAVLVKDGVIADVVQGQGPSPAADIRVIDGKGAMLAPGLIDLRVKTGEPGSETKETLKSASRAAAAGGVTSIVGPGGQILILDLREHGEAWVRDRLGDAHLGFSERTLTHLLEQAGYTHIRVSVGTRLAGDPFVVLVASGVKAFDTDSPARRRTSAPAQRPRARARH